ncbi:phosphotransferase family protein [uncultured Devosia sp.]|uniref:phosphotransferase family protein n=1 Tax=uncultured Devosia sp. TaxID=211434 RepID=UPI0035CA3CDD
MPMVDPDMSLDQLAPIIVATFPELAGSSFSLLSEGWDSVAVDVDDRLIFKFPRNADAERALAMEARLLAAIRPVIATPVPDLEVFETPRRFSRHCKLKGEHLLTADYERLPDDDRQHLARAMAQFFAQLHRLERQVMADAGAKALEGWPHPDYVAERALPQLSGVDRALAERTLVAWQELPPDPLGEVYGFFDGHGWNMAFDHQRRRLNGIYDFADSGFGPLQQEFVYPSLVSHDLTARIIGEYEAMTGKALNRERINLLTGVLHLVEIAWALENPDMLATLLGFYRHWADRQPV